jgi:hypothetical protein
MSLSTDQKLALAATSDAKLSGANVEVSAQAKLELKGGTQASLQSLKVSIAGDTQAELKAPMTNVGQDLTTIKGSIVKVDGQLIKLG